MVCGLLEEFPSDEVREEVPRSLWELEDDVTFSRLASPHPVLESEYAASLGIPSGGILLSQLAGSGPGPDWASDLHHADPSLFKEDLVSMQETQCVGQEKVAFSADQSLGLLLRSSSSNSDVRLDA
ncbi:unnamed protein product [Calypogeia fissa]